MNIEELGLDLEMKTFNRLKKAGISTVDELLAEMYSPGSKVSQPDAKRCEEVLKAAGIIKYMRGDEVEESDIEPEPLTWDELHSYIGRLVVEDCSTESHRWLKVCWIYDIQDEGEGNLIYNDGSSSYGYVRRSSVNGEFASRRSPFLKYEGQFFALKTSEVPQEQSSPVIVETAEYTRAVKLHRCICANAQAAQESLYEMCKALKEMHDQKLYRELGYSSFEDYTEKEVGIKRVQAYKYVAIGSIENVHSSEQIGVTKLALLAKLDEQERTELAQNTDLENTSVRELKKEIARLQSSNAILQGNITDELKKSAKLQTQLESKHREWLQACDEKTSYAQQLFHAEETVRSLENQVEKLENRPVDVLIHNNDEEIDRLTAQFQEELEKRDKDTEQRLEQQRQLHKKQIQELSEKYEKEADEDDKELTDKAQLDCTIRFAEDALRRLIKFIMVLDNAEYAKLAAARIETVFSILRKYEEEK